MSKTALIQNTNYPRLARWFFFEGAKHLRKRLLLLLFLTVLAVFSESISLMLIVPVLRMLIPAGDQSPGELSEPGMLTKSIDFLTGIVPENLQFLFSQEYSLFTLLTVILLLVAAKAILNLVTTRQAAVYQWKLMSGWSKKLLKVYLEKDYLSFLNYKHGKMLGNIIVDTRIAAKAVRQGISFFSQLILSIAYIAILFYTSWQIALFQLVTIFVLVAITWEFTHRLTLTIGKEMFTAKQQAEATASESLSALRQIKASATEREAVAKFSKSVDEMAKLMVRYTTNYSVPKHAGEVLLLLLIIITIYYLYSFTDMLTASQIPIIVLLIFIANRLFVSLAILASEYMAFTGSLPAMQQIAALLEQKRDKDLRTFDPTHVDLTKDIVFSNGSLRYPGKSKKILDGLNFTIEGGKVTVLVGASGGGKSTIIDLLLGFIQLDEGTLLLDGQDSRQLDFASIRKKIGYVSQEVFLFNCSIRENLLIHKPDATEAEIRQACQKANIAGFIEGLPESYGTPVGDRGFMLSGGERQRLAIAIAFLRNSELIIFDEPTNALDSETEFAVLQGVRGLKDKTVFFVTHKISPALQPNHIYRLKDGKVKEIEIGEIKNDVV